MEHTPFPKMNVIAFADPDKEVERRWNAHDEMLAALEDIRVDTGLILTAKMLYGNEREFVQSLYDKTEAAIKNAAKER